MLRKHILFGAACVVVFMTAVTSCRKEKNPGAVTPSVENGFNGGFGYVGGFVSENQNFETDWASET